MIALGCVMNVGTGPLTGVPPEFSVMITAPTVMLVVVVGTATTTVVALLVTVAVVKIVLPRVTVLVVVYVDAGVTVVPTVLVSVPDTVFQAVVVNVAAGSVRVLVKVSVLTAVTVAKVEIAVPAVWMKVSEAAPGDGKGLGSNGAY